MNISDEWGTMSREGDGVMELRVYTVADAVTLMGAMMFGDPIAGREASGISMLLGQYFEAPPDRRPTCWICNGEVNSLAMVVLISAHCDDPSRALGGLVCPRCYDPQADMVRRAAEALKKDGLIGRELTVHPKAGHS